MHIRLPQLWYSRVELSKRKLQEHVTSLIGPRFAAGMALWVYILGEIRVGRRVQSSRGCSYIAYSVYMCIVLL